MSDQNPIEELRELEWIVDKVIMIAGIAFRMGKANVQLVKTLAAIMKAEHKDCKAAQEFTGEFGGDTGYLQMKTVDERFLKHFEMRLKHEGVEYARLPRLNSSEGTFYMYYLDKLPELKNVITTYEDDRLSQLSNLNEKYGGESERYIAEKQRLEEQMPEISLVTVEEYTQTAYTKDGQETPEYTVIKEDVLQQEKAEHREDKSTDAIASFFREAKIEEDISTEVLIAVAITAIDYDKIERNGIITEVARVQVDDDLTLVLPREAVRDKQNILIDKNKDYKLLRRNGSFKIVKGSDLGNSLVEKTKLRGVVELKTPEITLPTKAKRKTR